ncbi:MAG: VOC family protein [Myxococcota bacterium]
MGDVTVLFAPPEPGVAIAPQHVAFRVEQVRFDAAVAHLAAAGIPYGDHPTHVGNGRTVDRLGARARVYFFGADGHLFELVALALSP